MDIETDKNISLQSDQSLERVAEGKRSFQKKVLTYNALACQSGSENFDSQVAISESQDNLIALDARGALQEMLAAQMTSIHLLQQTSAALANCAAHPESKRSYTHAAIKLAHCFNQQAALFAKLKGFGSQKIIVKHVEVHDGGQAIVANISREGVPDEHN